MRDGLELEGMWTGLRGGAGGRRQDGEGEERGDRAEEGTSGVKRRRRRVEDWGGGGEEKDDCSM